MQKNTEVQNSLDGQYKFDIRHLFEQAWQQTQANKWVIVQALLAIGGAAFCIIMLVFAILDVRTFDDLTTNARMTLDILLTIVLAPFFAAILMMAINSSVGKQILVKQLFDTLPHAALLSLTALLTAFMEQLGMILLVLPGLYLAIATGFAMPLVVDKNMMPSRAIVLSIRVVSRYWLSFIKLYALFFCLFLLSVFTLGIALIWVLPLYYNMKGLLYRDLFGVVQGNQGQPSVESKNGVFHA